MRTQTFGVELEMTGITRKTAAEVAAAYFGTTSEYIGGGYDKYAAKDSTGRLWCFVSDSSIRVERGRNGEGQQVELVTPILRYEDIELLQELIRRLRKAGAKTNSSCGIHIHIGADQHTPRSLRNLVNIFTSKQDIIFKALAVDSGRERYCSKLENRLSESLNKSRPNSMNKVADIWYAGYSGDRNAHYNSSRYHAVNLHSVFTKGTVEFRCFNSTLHAGKVKAYVQFCLAVSYQAITQKCASAKPTVSDNEKYTFRCWLLRMGLIGDEFATCRKFMLENLDGDIAWRYGQSA